MREKIFVCYSHEDKDWLDRLKKRLGGGIYAKAFEMWSDQEIATGANWKREIYAAIASSRIALLLVSRHFLNSNFIINDELPSILRRHEAKQAGQPDGISIWSVLLDKISKSELEDAGLYSIQAGADISEPLSELDEKELDRAISNLSSKLLNQVKLATVVGAAALNQFKIDVAKALSSVNTVINDALAPGEYSVIYRATRGGVEVAVKALFPLPGREWMGKDFIARANSVRHVKNAAAIQIRDVFDRETKCVVMEFVDWPTLRVQLNQLGNLPAMRVADALAQLADVAAELHQRGQHLIIGPIRPSHVHYDLSAKKVRISLVHIANETLQSCLQRPTLLLGSDALTYLIPERYFGQEIGPSADQYYFGLLALELLQGKPPVEVSVFANLETKRKFFDHPRSFFADLSNEQPAFSFILTKMLEKDPQNRWTSMSELAESLRDVAAGIVPKAVRNCVAEQYRTKLRNNMIFFDQFYHHLFESSEEIGKIFTQRGARMEEQHKKLAAAVQSLFHFDRRIGMTTLDDEAARHLEFGIKAEHFDLFKAAFLESLCKAKIADGYSHDAWRAILDPALAFMKERATIQ